MVDKDLSCVVCYVDAHDLLKMVKYCETHFGKVGEFWETRNTKANMGEIVNRRIIWYVYQTFYFKRKEDLTQFKLTWLD